MSRYGWPVLLVGIGTYVIVEPLGRKLVDWEHAHDEWFIASRHSGEKTRGNRGCGNQLTQFSDISKPFLL